jgi:hypothetical protein
MKKKSARSVKKRKEAALPYNRKDPRQLKLILTPGDEFETTVKVKK